MFPTHHDGLIDPSYLPSDLLGPKRCETVLEGTLSFRSLNSFKGVIWCPDPFLFPVTTRVMVMGPQVS